MTRILEGHVGDSEKAALYQFLVLEAPACCEPWPCSGHPKNSPLISLTRLMWWLSSHPRPSALDRLVEVRLKLGRAAFPEDAVTEGADHAP